MELFILEINNDKDRLEHFYFKWNSSKITIEKIYDSIKEHKRICEDSNIKYNYILAIRKLESLGLKQISSTILTI